MSIQPATPQLCSVFLEDPQAIASSHNCKGYLYKIAALISAAALVIIFTGAMAIYLGMLAELPGWGLALALIAAMGCMKGLDFWGSGSREFARAATYQAYADQYKEISGWGILEIRNFFTEEGVTAPIDNAGYTALTQKSPEEPFSALLPVIARYQVLEKQNEKLDESIQKNIQMANENYANGEGELELKHGFTVLQLSEELAFNRFNQATLLQNLLRPTEEHEWGVAPLGFIERKDPMMRALDFIAQRDRVFFRRREGDLPNLTREDLIANPPNWTRQMIFDAPLPQQG